MFDVVFAALALALMIPMSLFIAVQRTSASRARLLRAYKEAYERGDLAEVARLRPLVRAGLPDTPSTRNSEKVGDGETHLLHERWAQARDVLATVDFAILPKTSRPGVLSNLAYATAQAGEPERGIELVRDALAQAEALGGEYPQEKLPYLRGTHGVALHLAGRHEEAIDELEPLMAVETPKRARTTRAYYLAQSYRALGRFGEAAATFTVAAGGVGPFAQRARDALANLHPHRS